MAKSRTNSKSKLTKKSKGNVPKWAVAAVVVLVVAVAGYAIVRFSQAGTENIGDKLRVRYAASNSTNSPPRGTNQELFRCYGSTQAITQKGETTVCGLARGQHATGFWYDEGIHGVDFNNKGKSLWGGDNKAYICADVWLGPNGTSAYITTEVPGKRPETKGGVKSNISPQGRVDRVCTLFEVDRAGFWSFGNSQLAGDVLIARLYNASPASVPGGAVTVSRFYFLKN